MRFLVTGATGLVGGTVAECLVASGETVRALVRRPAAAEGPHLAGVDVRRGDLSDAESLRASLEGVDVVVHCAAIVNVSGAPAGLWDVNVHGTERLLEAAAAAGVRRFVHLSSVAVYGYGGRPPIREDAAKRPTGLYGRSKWAAEQAVWRAHAERGLPAVALRPCVIYGDAGRDRHATPELARLARLRVVPLPDGGRRLLDMVHVTDVAAGVIAAAHAPDAVGRAYNLTDGERHGYRDVLLAWERAGGRRPAIVPVPRPLFRAVLAVPGPLRRLRVLDCDLHYAIEAAARDLGYRPAVSLVEGLARAFSSRAS